MKVSLEGLTECVLNIPNINAEKEYASNTVSSKNVETNTEPPEPDPSNDSVTSIDVSVPESDQNLHLNSHALTCQL